MIPIAWKAALSVVVAIAPFGLQQPQAPAASASTSAPVKFDSQDSFTVVGLTVRTTNQKEAGGQGEIPRLWQEAMESGSLEQIPNRADNDFVVVYSDYVSDHNGEYSYTLGVRVTSADKVPAGYVVRTIRAGRYAVFTSEQGAPQQIVPALWQHINSLTPQQMGGARAYQTDFEIYPPITDPSSMQMEAHIGLK